MGVHARRLMCTKILVKIIVNSKVVMFYNVMAPYWPLNFANVYHILTTLAGVSICQISCQLRVM
jgi:hypothetical protein